MPKARKTYPADSAQRKNIRVGMDGDVVDSTIIVGNGNIVMQPVPPPSAEVIEHKDKLTEAYCRAVEGEWTVLRVNDAAIPLEDVYVMLQAVASPPPRPIGERSELAPAPERLEHAGIQENKAGQSSPPVPVELSQALKEAPHLALLGEPGAGKSTTLQFIGLCFVHENWAETRLQLREQRVPIKLDLRQYAELLSRPGPSMEEALACAVREFLRSLTAEQAQALIGAWADGGQLLVLLDGLDEVPERLRPGVREQIVRYAAAMRETVRLAVASRLAGYSALGGTFKDFMLKPFERAEEAIPYLQGWLAAFGVPDAAKEAAHLHDEMARQPALRRVLDNPLLLRIAAQVYARQKTIAQSRADLYRLYTEDLWTRAVEQRGVERARKDDVWQAIEELAWQLQSGRPPALATEMDIIVREKMGLVARHGESLFFSHTTLQEYFVAQRLKRAWETNRQGCWAFLRPRLHIAAWREPLLLLCGSLAPADAEDLIRRVLKARSPYERRLRRDLFLAAALMGENTRISSSLRQRVIRLLLKALRDEDENVHKTAAYALGKISSAKESAGLLQALQDEDRDVRQAAAEVLGKVGSAAVPGLLQTLRDEKWEVREAAADALGETRLAEAVPGLLQALRDEKWEVRQAAAEALGKIGSAAVPGLLQALQDKQEKVRRTAAYALGETGSAEAVPGLLRAMQDESPDVRWEAGIALRKIGSAEATPGLLQTSRDEEMGQAAVKTPGEIGLAEAVPALLQALQDEDWNVRRTAAEALGKIGLAAAVLGLLQTLRDKNEDVRWAAAKALGEIGLTEAVPGLLKALEDEDAWVRWTAAYALGKIGSTEAIPGLLQALQDSEMFVRKAVAEALEEILTTIPVPTDRKELWQQVRWLRKLIASKDYPGDKTPLANHLAVLQLADSPYQDPFQKLSPSPAWKALRVAAILLAAALAALLGLLYSVSEEALKSLLGAAVSGWIRAHHGAAFALLVFLAVLLALLTWGTERLKKVE